MARGDASLLRPGLHNLKGCLGFGPLPSLRFSFFNRATWSAGEGIDAIKAFDTATDVFSHLSSQTAYHRFQFLYILKKVIILDFNCLVLIAYGHFNVLGALDAVTHELITVTNDTYINAHSFCQLLWIISYRYCDVPITLVLDNARYQKCALVFALAEFLNIELLYLPAYSPNLNLIERLWKFVKKKCLYSKYYDNFDEFKRSITDCLSKTHTDHKKELDTLLTLKFQRFEESQIKQSI